MKRKLASLALVLVIVAGAWLLYHKDQVQSPGDAWELASGQFNSVMGSLSGSLADSSSRETLRIASFNVNLYGPQKAQQPDAVSLLARILDQFDVIALQDVEGDDRSAMAPLLEALNANGTRQFDYVASNPVGRAVNLRRYVILFDRRVVELDGSRSYTVEDPDDLFRRQPLVGWFRTRHRDPSRAFTFSLVNVHLDTAHAHQELAQLSQLFRAVRNDGRNEDDVILCGGFYAGEKELLPLRESSGLTWAISGDATDTRRSGQYDNIVFCCTATAEFTGRSGVFDFLKHFNLTLDEALAISNHLPVWAEFSMAEDMPPGASLVNAPR